MQENNLEKGTNKPAIILVSPQLGQNIGAVARAMKNFSLNDLRIVNPVAHWPNEDAEASSVGAIDIIRNAKIFSSLDDAISDIVYLYATSARVRDINKDYVLSKDLKNEIDFSNKIGIMFGRESSGLSNDELKYANKIITIDTDPGFSSLNIAQSVIIVCYEIFERIPRLDLENKQDLATKDEMNMFYEHLFSLLDNGRFFRNKEIKKYMVRNITNIFSRIDKLSKTEYQTLRGILSTISKKEQ